MRQTKLPAWMLVKDALPAVISVLSILLYRDRAPFMLRSGNHLALRN